MAACGTQHEISSNTIRSGFHFIAGKLCGCPCHDAHGCAFQNSFSFSIKNFHALFHFHSSFNCHLNSNRKAA
jgi:hypothetical protein